MENISCWFGTQEVLRNLTIDVRPAETLVIIGESGCGKSVSMKVMMQLLRQTEGDVFWFDDCTSTLSARHWRETRLKLGYLFQGAALFDSLNVFDNVAFGLRENGTGLGTSEKKGADPFFPARSSTAEIAPIVFQRLEEVGLGRDVAKKRPSELSGGMQKRVALARALTLNPDVMFYDEPTTGLDPITSRRIDDLIGSVQQKFGVSSVIVTHDMKTVERVADRVIMLRSCARLENGAPQKLFEGSVAELFSCTDPRVSRFVRGETDEAVPETAPTSGSNPLKDAA